MAVPKRDEIGFDEWSLWSNHVLIELKRLNSSIDDLRKDLNGVIIETAKLKVKSSVWGAVSGAVTVLLIFGVSFVKSNVTEKQSGNSQPSYIYYTQPGHPIPVNPPQAIPVTPGTNP
jgi:hypothetical protein